jgi:hypothetical protein
VKRANRIHLGSWAIFSDIAGWIRENPDNPIVTIAAVAIPPERVKKRRAQLLEAFDGAPVKWKKGGLTGWRRIAHVITKSEVHVAVSQVYRVGEPWRQFYSQTNAFLSAAATRLGEVPVYLSADNNMRMTLLMKGFAALSGRLMRMRYPSTARQATFHADIVCDSDLKGAEAEAFWCRAVEEWPTKNSELLDVYGVHQTVRARLASDESEPLLLLPDYVAGLYHHADPRTWLAVPVAPPQDASLAVEELRARKKARLHELPEDFSDTFPLVHDDLGRVRVRDLMA